MRKGRTLGRFALGAVFLAAAGVASAQEPPQPEMRAPQTGAPQRAAFHAVHYDVKATLTPSDQSIQAHARVDLVADEASRVVEVELNPNLSITSVTSADGKPLTVDRNPDSPLNLRVTLPDALAVGRSVSLLFNYGGPLAGDSGLIKGVRLAYISADSIILLQPARWFPLTDYPSNRYTAVFELTLPDSFGIAGTGESAAPTPVAGTGKGPSQVSYRFVCDRAAPVGTFVAGKLQLTPVRAEGMEIPVFVNPSRAASATAYGQSLANIIAYFSSEFGPLPRPNFTIAELPEGTLSSFAAPGLLLVGSRLWTDRPNQRLLAELAAHAWWDDQVLPASASDVWLSDGLSRYSEALFAEQSGGAAALHRALDEFSVGSLMDDSAAPIAQAQQLDPFTTPYRSVVVNKGAMVFHMLRNILGESAFLSLLHDFYAQYSGRTARIADFEKMAEARLAQSPPPAPAAGTNVPPPPPANLPAFFAQWLDSTGIPEFKLDYIVYRNKAGFKIVGKITQDLETFRMPIEIRVDTEGNPETKVVNVVGTSSPFEITTFGRPKPNGITIDPNNNLLKSSPRLRVRALIATGEALAESGQLYDAIQQYQKALELQSNNSLAAFRMGEAFFYQKNLQASANSFRSALDGDLDPAYKWVEVWCHIYLGKIFDLTGQRERAVNEYTKAEQIKDDTGGAQEEAARYISQPYKESSPATTAQPGNR